MSSHTRIQLAALLGVCVLLTATSTMVAQTAPGFDMVGFIQKATVIDATNPLSGGMITINNHPIIVPANSIVQMPARALGWGEVFSLAPAAQNTTGESGLAMSDRNRLPGTYEAHVQGNIIGTSGSQQYIAGLIFISQQSLNAGQGFIDKIDYTSRQIHVNGTILTINDPIGRFSGGIKKSADVRFSIDEDNPTVRTQTAYPMCMPAVAPPAIDPLCPQFNRPPDSASPNGKLMTFTMIPPANVVPGTTDPRLMAPFEVGDYITYAGELQTDGSIAAHQIIANVGIYTAAGTDPAYVAIDVLLQGTGAPLIQAVGIEATAKVKVEGFSTDPSRTVDAYAMDNLCGKTQDRWWATIAVDPGPPTGAKLGRFRYRPAGGAFLPPAQNVRVRVTPSFTCQVNGFPCLPTATETLTGNGLVAGQYSAPNFAFVFPETLAIGGPPSTSNFSDFPWLINGVGSWNGIASGRLSPWPDNVTPSPSCTFVPPPAPVPPVAVATASPTTVNSGDVITLDGTASQASPTDSYIWTQTSGPAAAITNANSPAALAAAPPVSSSSGITFKLTVSNAAGSSSAQTTVTVNPKTVVTPVPPVIESITAVSPVAQGIANNQLAVVASDSNGQALTYTWTQSAGPTAKIASPTSASTTFTAPVLAFGSQPATITFSVTVRNQSLLSANGSVVVTVNPPPDSISISTATYQRLKARLQVLVGDNVISPNISLTCSIPVINPATGQNYKVVAAGPGPYLVTFTGVPLPSSVSCWSSASPNNIQSFPSSRFTVR